jgi:cysteinyl-tRNA synthetase
MIKFCRRTLEEGENEKECLMIMKKSVVELCEILGLKVGMVAAKFTLPADQIENLIKEREEARKNKNFKRADEIREQLQGQGIDLEDTPLGTKWKA